MTTSPSRRARLLAVVPLVVLVAWAGLLAKDVWATKVYEDPQWVLDHVGAIDSYEGNTKPLTLPPDDPNTTARIFVVGSSSVAAQNPEQFTDPLATHLGELGHAVQVSNIGWEGMTAHDLNRRLNTALQQVDEGSLRLDGVVLYLGHNEFTYTYHYALAMPRFDALVGPTWVAQGEWLRERDGGDLYWLYAHRRVPRVLKFLQEVGWLHLNERTFHPLLERTLAAFNTDLDTMLATLKARGIPALLVTPIGNLEIEPYGPIGTSTELWKEGLATKDPAVRMQVLIMARDSEVFSPDLRAKSGLLNLMRDKGVYPQPGAPVQLCDLEVRLPDQGVYMDASMFTDAVHMTEHGHEAVTRTIAGCLSEGVFAHTEPVDQAEGVDE